MKLIIDERIRKIEYEYLSKFLSVVKMPLSDDVYDEISGHSDIFYCKINNSIICAPNAPIIESSFIIGKSIVKNKYPHDIPYNACQIGNTIIGSKFTDEMIPINMVVKQGYTKCSISVTGNSSCITSDIGIYKKLAETSIDVLYIKEENIFLLDKKGDKIKKGGFIGGASFVFADKFVLFGDIDKLENKLKILEHLKTHKLQLIDFKGFDIYDYGGVIFF